MSQSEIYSTQDSTRFSECEVMDNIGRIGGIFFCMVGIGLSTIGLTFSIIKSDLLLGGFTMLMGTLTALCGVYTYEEASK